MSTESLTLEEPGTAVGWHAVPSGLRTLHPCALGLISGVGLWLAFPPAEWHGLAWVALVPLFLLVDDGRSKLAYLSAWIGGLAFWMPATEWVRLTDPSAWLAWLLMGVVLSLFWPLFLGLTRLGVRRLRLPLMIAAPMVWVALEYVREYFLTGFPWYYLAHTQFRRLSIIQIADFTGVWGVSFVIALVNSLIAELLVVPLFRETGGGRVVRRAWWVRFASALAVVGATLGYGLFRLNTADFKPGPTVALIQSNIIQRLNSGREPDKTLMYYDALVDKALASGAKLDLIVWPETSYPYGFVSIAPDLGDAALQAQIDELMPDSSAAEWRSKRELIDAQLHGWVTQRTRTPMLFGTIYYEFHPQGRARYNSALLIEPDKAEVQAYHKMHLVPFGEYVPLIQSLPWLTYLTPYRGSHTPSLTFGAKPAWIDRGPYRYAVAICFEDTLPHVVRPLFSQVPDGHSPDVLLNQSNDGWFHDSTAEHVMHLACSVFRAVEHRAPLARAANTGVSAVVDGNGRIVASLETGTEERMVDGVLVETIPLDPREGLYTKVGDWAALGCLAGVLGWWPLAKFRERKARKRA